MTQDLANISHVKLRNMCKVYDAIECTINLSLGKVQRPTPKSRTLKPACFYADKKTMTLPPSNIPSPPPLKR